MKLRSQKALALTFLVAIPFLLFACDIFNVKPPKNENSVNLGLYFYNAPDPFSTETVFTVEGWGIQAITVQIMNLNRELLFERQASGNKSRWDGTDFDGDPLPNGDYLYLIEAVGRDWTHRSDTLTLHIRGR